MNATFSIRESADVTIIDVAGRITFGGPAYELRSSIGLALQQGVTKILLNLAGAEYLDSTGIGELLAGVRAAGEHGAALKLLNVPRRIRDLLRLTGVFDVFEQFSDEAAAVASFA